MRPILLTLIVLSAPASIFACTCATPTVDREIASATVIFVGTARNIANPTGAEDLAQVTFEIRAAWKRALPKVFTVHTVAFTTACGYLPAIGGDYLVFAHQGSDGRLHVSHCSNNQPFACAPPVVEKLGKPAVTHAALPSLEGLGTDPHPLPPYLMSSRCTTPPQPPPDAHFELPPGVDVARFEATVLRDGRVRDAELHLSCGPASSAAQCTVELQSRVKAAYESWRYRPAQWNGAPVAMRIAYRWPATMLRRAPASRSPR